MNRPNNGSTALIVDNMAQRYSMSRDAFVSVLKATVLPKECTGEQFIAFLQVAKQYDLNPFVREIYAFPGKGGGIQPIVSVDGWLRIINAHPQLDGIQFEDEIDSETGMIRAIKARIHRKDRKYPVEVTEYLAECRRPTEPWQKWPIRMLRHKALIQCARYAFGFSGIVEPDEYERMGVVPPPEEKPRRPIKREQAERLKEQLKASLEEERKKEEKPEMLPVIDVEETVDPETGEILEEPQVEREADNDAYRQCYQEGYEAHERGASATQWPARYGKDKVAIDAWTAGWKAAG